MDPYKELEVGKNATQDEITKAYRKLAMKWHPDRNPKNQQAAEEKFKTVKEAYESLTDPVKIRAREEREAAAGSPFGRPFAAGRSSRSYHSDVDVDDLFEQMFGASARKQSGGGFSGFDTKSRGWTGTEDFDAYDQGADIESRISIPLRKALAGGRFAINLTRHDGKEETIEFTLRPGIGDGERVVAPGKGGPARGKGRPGDLILTIALTPDPLFERAGDDLTRPLSVPFARCVLGGEMPVEMPDGSWVNVTIPAGASSGMKLRLRGKGAQKFKGGAGDLYCRIEPAAPKKVLAKERKVWERIAALQEAADQPKD